jgi:nucleoid-associated protein YgaU
MKLWFNPAMKGKTLTAYANTKYGLFLRNPVTYTVTASGKNVVTQTTEKMIEAKNEVTKVAVAKDSVVKQVKSLKRDEGCLISDD